MPASGSRQTRQAGPAFALVYGTAVSGKTRFRHDKYASGYVTVDAGDIFRRLAKGQILEFPGELESVLDLIGRSVADRAIEERRNIVTEAFGVDPEFLKATVAQMKGIGYSTRIDFLRGTTEQAEQWNVARGPDNISSYYTDAFNLNWLMDAAKAHAPEHDRADGSGSPPEER